MPYLPDIVFEVLSAAAAMRALCRTARNPLVAPYQFDQGP